jgi:hypothetical protein
MMKPEAQQIAIKEACGWRPDSRGLGWLSPQGCYDPEPDYLTDLNAMHDAEKMLIRPNLYAKGGWGTYLRHLSIVTDEQHPIDATAAQRAEAFLRAVGKWEGE